MAVTYISSGARSGATAGETASSTTLTFSSVNAGAGDFLLVLAVRFIQAAGNFLTGVTFGATSLTEKIQYNPYDGTNATAPIAAFFLPAPVGTDALGVTYAAVSNGRAAAYYVLSGVDTSAPFGTIFTKHVPGAFNTINDNQPATVGGLMIDCVGLRNNFVSEDPTLGGSGGGTERHTVGQGTAVSLFTGTAPGAALVQMAWSWTTNSSYRNYMMIPVNPAPAVVPGNSRALLLGVG